MKLSEFKNEEAIDLLADIFEPATKILGDKELVDGISAGLPQMTLIKKALKNHKKEIIEILAITDGVPVDKYTCSPVTILSKLLELMNDKELLDFFSAQGQMDSQTSSGSVTETTKAEKK